MPLNLPGKHYFYLSKTCIDLMISNNQTAAGNNFKGNSFMLSSDPDPEVNKRFVSLQLMDTISSNESKQTSEFRPL